MELCDLLGIRGGVVSLIGGGGKTTMLWVLARELGARGRVGVCTTTHIRPPTELPLVTGGEIEALAAWGKAPVLCLGTPAPEGKLTASPIPVARLAELCDYVLVEADGARQHPCKAHAPHEPVIPPESGLTVLLLGAEAFGQSIGEGAHRPQLYAPLAGAGAEDRITPRRAAAVLQAEGLHDCVFINQMESEEQQILAQALAELLPCPVFGGALQRGEWKCLSSFEGAETWPPASP